MFRISGFMYFQIKLIQNVWRLPQSDGEAVLLALYSLPHSVVEVVVAMLDHLGNQLQEGLRSEVVGMAITVLLGVMVVGSLRDLLRK